MSMRVLGTDAEPAFGRQAAAFLIVFSLLIGFLVLPRRMSPFIPAAQAAPPIGLDGGSITSLDTPYTEFFDTLASSGTNLAWTDNVTLKGWYSSRTTYNSGTGSSNTGALYSFGTSAADRALGAQRRHQGSRGFPDEAARAAHRRAVRARSTRRLGEGRLTCP